MASGFTDRDVPSQTGRTALVTGANTGIGYHVAEVLARRGARVLLGCRSTTKGADAADRIRAASPGADVDVVELDQASLSSVAEASEAVVAGEDRLDLLVNNAGIMMTPYGLTDDGFEQQFGVNHLGTFALTGQLLPKLAEQSGSRVVNTASLAHLGGRIQFDDLIATGSYDAQDRYQQSKLANLMHTLELDRRLQAAGSPVAAVCCHPGIAATELVRHFPGPAQMLMPLVGLALNTAAQGAWATLMAATEPGVESGEYLGPTGWREMRGPAGRARIAGRAKDEQVAARLWDVSVELTGVDPGI